MTLTQMHERLRLELLRRIQRGSLSVSLLSRQTGFGQSHISNYLRGRRGLSLESMDRVLTAQGMLAADLLPASAARTDTPEGEGHSVPVVSYATALFEPYVRSVAIQAMLRLPPGLLDGTRARTSGRRASWQRFVAVSVSAAEAEAMDPVVMPKATVLLDRHYNSLAPYRSYRRNLYAVQYEGHLKLRYLELVSGRLLLRPHNRVCRVDLIELGDDQSPGDFIAGRAALILNEL